MGSDEQRAGHRVSIQLSAFECHVFRMYVAGRNARLERRVRGSRGSKENNDDDKNGGALPHRQSDFIVLVVLFLLVVVVVDDMAIRIVVTIDVPER